ncbi:MAG TPA: hypothetical protein VNA89_02285 [Gemmatimonadaceae bacterium]|nr:hypothetical protein [Gemmatimonadaceae bacterium]
MADGQKGRQDDPAKGAERDEGSGERQRAQRESEMEHSRGGGMPGQGDDGLLEQAEPPRPHGDKLADGNPSPS